VKIGIFLPIINLIETKIFKREEIEEKDELR
jgi:hypothetical protein